jgi:hypothetical protein
MNYTTAKLVLSCLFHNKKHFSLHLTLLPFSLVSFSPEETFAPQASVRNIVKVKVKVKLILRPTVSRPVCLGVGHPSGTRDQFFLLPEISFRQLRVCYFVAPSLTRERVCNLLFLLVLARAVPRDSRPYFIVQILETPPNLEGQVPVFISPRNRVA